jgi:hypothetical protein
MMEPVHKILALSYSQSGQLHQITRFFIDALHNVDIDYQTYEPENPFPFPWTSDAFFDTMPESVMEKPVKLKKINYKHIQYDLIIFAYQPWFLSPSIPASSILQDADFISRLKGTPVITLIGTRNMWLNSQNSVKKRIADAGGFIIGNIPFADRTQNQISAITILHWMLTGQKTKKWGMFPKPGVNDTDIGNASRYGEILENAIRDNDFEELQTKFLNLGLITLPTEIIFIEEKAKRLFRIWVKLVTNIGTTPRKRKWMISAYKYYLVFALFVVAPIVWNLYRILVAPFFYKSYKQKKKLYLQIS